MAPPLNPFITTPNISIYSSSTTKTVPSSVTVTNGIQITTLDTEPPNEWLPSVVPNWALILIAIGMLLLIVLLLLALIHCHYASKKRLEELDRLYAKRWADLRDGFRIKPRESLV